MDRTVLYRELVRLAHPTACKEDSEPKTYEPDAVTQEINDIATQISRLTKAIKDIRPRYIAVSPPLQLQPHEKQEYDFTLRHLLSSSQRRVRRLEKKESEQEPKSTDNSLSGWLFSNPQAEEMQRTISKHRKAMLFYLNLQLTQASTALSELHHIQLSREVPKNLHKSDHEISISKSKSHEKPDFSFQSSIDFEQPEQPQSSANPAEQQSNEQTNTSENSMQLLMEERDTLLESLDARLEQAKRAESSLQEINELQNELAQHLSLQSQQLDSLMADAIRTEANVDDANSQLKRAQQKAHKLSRIITYTSVGIGVFLLIVNGK